MTDNTQPKAREFTMSQYASKDDMIGAMRKRIAELEAELEAVGAGGVQALSAAPEAIAKLRHLYQNMVNGAVRDTASAKRIAEGLLAPAIEALGRATPPAEQQAAPKAAPGEPDKLMRDCLSLLESFDYEDDEDSQSKAFFNAHINADWFFHVKHSIERQLEAKAAPQQEAQEPVMIYHGRCTIDCGEHGHHDMEMLRMIPAGSKLYTAPQPAPAPLSEMPYEKRKAIQEGEQISASDAWFKARHEMLDTLDRRNVFRAGFDRGWNAALAAQGGKDA